MISGSPHLWKPRMDRPWGYHFSSCWLYHQYLYLYPKWRFPDKGLPLVIIHWLGCFLTRTIHCTPCMETPRCKTNGLSLDDVGYPHYTKPFIYSMGYLMIMGIPQDIESTWYDPWSKDGKMWYGHPSYTWNLDKTHVHRSPLKDELPSQNEYIIQLLTMAHVEKIMEDPGK